MGILATLFEHPLDSLVSILTPSVPITSTGGVNDVITPGPGTGPNAALYALFGSGGDDLTSARIRASGVDPSTGNLLPGYSGPSGQSSIDATTSAVTGQYATDYQNFFASNSLWPFSGNDSGSSSSSGSSTLIVVLVVLVLLFVFFKVVK
jgi:hypothetical protein